MGAAASVTQPRQLKDLKAVAASHNVDWTPALQKAFNTAKKRTKVAAIKDVLGHLPKTLQLHLQKIIDDEAKRAEDAVTAANTKSHAGGKSASPKAASPPAAAGDGAAAAGAGGGSEADAAAAVKVQAVVRGRQARVARKPKEETPEELAKRLDEEAAAAKAAREAELLARKDGHITCHYNMYHEKFAIKDNTMKAFDIDDMYCLSDVMPGCIVRLSYIDNTKFKGERWELPFVKDDTDGILRDLMDGEEYWVVVIENEEQLKRDQAETAARMAVMNTHNKFSKDEQHVFCRAASFKLVADAGEPQMGVARREGCSCLYGNPCTDKYVCQDWENRNAVARKNGWKG